MNEARKQPDDDLLTLRETAERLGVHENTVRNWLASGIIRSARPPGSRFHRFEVSEVERVRLARQSGPESVQAERRIIGPELADATRLAVWAGTQEARHNFPRLIRRLLAATPGVENLEARAGEGVGVGGWDVRATLRSPTPWLPSGDVVFELGVGSSPAAKAQADYAKRSHNPLGVDPREVGFVFATPRRWPGGSKWAADRAAEGIWRTVHVLDGDAIEAWLDATPAVHYWISEQIGLQPHGVQTAEVWLDRFREQTRPALPISFILAGRSSARDELLKRLSGPADVIAVRSVWKEDAIAFVCASIAATAGGDDSVTMQRGLVVTEREVWSRVAGEPGAIVLIPLFAQPDVASPIVAGRHVVVPLGADDSGGKDVIQLPRPERVAAQEAFREAGLDFEAATRLAALARRSMPAMVRRLSINPSFRRPSWSDSPASDVLAPLVLVGGWAENRADHELISQLADRPWPEVERVLRASATSENPPFVESADTWRASSHEELFEVLVGSLTRSDVRRWDSVVTQVLSEVNRLIDLTDDQRLSESVKPEEDREPVVSTTLREGLADGLALLGALDDRTLVGTSTCGEFARDAVRKMLTAADAEESGALWRSLAPELPLIAEAAPEQFLDHVLEGSRGENPVLTTMFRDREIQPAFGTSSPHTGLLWALETLCWSSDYLLDATRALAQLAGIDPGGRLSNRPDASLVDVLLPWIRHTGAQLPVRLKAIDQIVRDFPDQGWKLVMGLWPSNRGFGMPPHTPRYRDWLPDQRTVLVPEWLAIIDHLVQHAIQRAAAQPERWIELVPRVHELPSAHQDRLIAALDAAEVDLPEDSEARLAVWEALNAEIARHLAFPDAQWVMPGETLVRLQEIAKRIEPSRNVERHAWLFDWHPDIPDVAAYDFDRYQVVLGGMREEAVREAIENGSIKGLAKLAERAVVPATVGEALATLFGDTYRETLLEWLEEEGPRLEVARGWLVNRAYAAGAEWVADVLRDLDDEEVRLAVAVQSPRTGELWRVLADSFPSLLDRYWKQVSPLGIRSEDTPTAVHAFISHDRSWAALAALAAELHRPREDGPTLDPELVQLALETAVAGHGEPERRDNSLGYQLGVLLDYLESRGTDPQVLARLEFTLFPVFEYQREPRALYSALAHDPELFVDLLSLVYRGKSEPRHTADARSAATARHAWHVLRHWRSVPGLCDDGTIDGKKLTEWVETARLLLRDRDRADVGDEQIGELLSGSPNGSDGAWPSEAVRDLVERLGSREIENGLHIGKANQRGMTSRGIYEGGQSERELAAQFRDWSSVVAGHWPRTSRLLRELAESYEREARRQDARASGDADA